MTGPLRALNGGRCGPRSARRNSFSESEQITCAKCKERDGVETSAMMIVRTTPRRDENGVISHWRDVAVCAFCFVKGEWIEFGEIQ